MKTYITLICAMCLLYGIKGFAQAGNTIALSSVNEAISRALDDNPNLTVYQLKQEQAAKNYKIAKAYRLPNITGSFSGQHNISLGVTPLPGEIFGQPGETVNVQAGQDYNFNAGININKTLFDWQLVINKKIAKSNIDLADLDEDVFKQGLIEQTALYYYSALITQEALKINVQDLKVADSIYTLSQQKFNEGLIDKIVVNKAKINYNTILQTKSSNTQLLNTYLKELHVLLGLEDRQRLVLEASITTDVPQLIDEPSLKADINLILLELQKEQSALKLKEEKAIYYPKIELNTYLGRQQFRNNFGLSFSSGAWTDYEYLSLNLSVPIFTGFANKNKVKVAQLDYDIATKNYDIELQKSQLNDAVLIQNFYAGFEGLSASVDNYEIYKENSELTFQKYSEGLIGLEDYFTAFEDYLKAQNNYLNTLSNTYSYHATILSRQEN